VLSGGLAEQLVDVFTKAVKVRERCIAGVV